MDSVPPFGWLDLRNLYKNPELFPSVEIVSEFPLFPLFTATAINILVSKTDAFNVGAVPVKNAGVLKHGRLRRSRALIEKPTRIFGILDNTERLNSWLDSIRLGLGASDKETQRELNLSNKNTPGKHDVEAEIFLDCLQLYAKNHAYFGAAKKERPNSLPYGLRARHLTALSILEHLDLLVRAYAAGIERLIHKHQTECIGALLAYSDASFYLNGTTTPHLSLPFRMRAVLLATIEFPDYKGVRPVDNNVFYPTDRKPSIRNLSREWQQLEQVSLFSRRRHVGYFISGLSKAVAQYQRSFGPRKGTLRGIDTADATSDHIKKLVLPLLLKDKNKSPWHSPADAAKALKGTVDALLQGSPSPLQASEKKNKKKTISEKSLEKILSEFEDDFPYLFEN